jgi:hypothetical protein
LILYQHYEKPTSNLDLVVRGGITQVAKTENSIVVLLLPLLGVLRERSWRLFLFTQTWVKISLAVRLFSLGSSSPSAQDVLVGGRQRCRMDRQGRRGGWKERRVSRWMGRCSLMGRF